MTNGIPITDKLVPTSPQDTYPTHDSMYGVGGYREVKELTELANIPPQRRRAGMLVYVESEDNIFKLDKDLVAWAPLDIGGGLSLQDVEIDENGDLILTYSNGIIQNAGTVRYEEPSDGKDGVNVTFINVNEDGDIIVVLSDGTTFTAGKVPAPVHIHDAALAAVSSEFVAEEGQTEFDVEHIGHLLVYLNGKLLPSDQVDLSEEDKVNLIHPTSTGDIVQVVAVQAEAVRGKDGRGIISTQLNEDFELIIIFDDGETVNVGEVRGQRGPIGLRGPIGPDGRQGPEGPEGPEGRSFVIGNLTEYTVEEATYEIDIEHSRNITVWVDNQMLDSSAYDAEDPTKIIFESELAENSKVKVINFTSGLGLNGVSVTGISVDSRNNLHMYFSDGTYLNAGAINITTGAFVDPEGRLKLQTPAGEFDVGDVIGPQGVSITAAHLFNDPAEGIYNALHIQLSDGTTLNTGSLFTPEDVSFGAGIENLALTEDKKIRIQSTDGEEFETETLPFISRIQLNGGQLTVTLADGTSHEVDGFNEGGGDGGIKRLVNALPKYFTANEGQTEFLIQHGGSVLVVAGGYILPPESYSLDDPNKVVLLDPREEGDRVGIVVFVDGKSGGLYAGLHEFAASEGQIEYEAPHLGKVIFYLDGQIMPSSMLDLSDYQKIKFNMALSSGSVVRLMVFNDEVGIAGAQLTEENDLVFSLVGGRELNVGTLPHGAGIETLAFEEVETEILGEDDEPIITKETHLMVTLTDGTVLDAGPLPISGSGILNIEVTENNTLQIELSDGEIISVPLPNNGPGIESVAFNEDNHLIITLTNGEMIDAGRVAGGGDGSGGGLTPYQEQQIALIDQKVDKVFGQGLSSNDFTNTYKGKLDGIEDKATKNSLDSHLLNRANHVGVQPISSVEGLEERMEEIDETMNGFVSSKTVRSVVTLTQFDYDYLPEVKADTMYVIVPDIE